MVILQCGERDKNKRVKCLPMHLPLNLRQKFCFKDAPCLEPFRDLSTEQESSFGKVYQNIPDYLPKVHATDHLFKPETKRKFVILFITSITIMKNSTPW